MSHNSATPVMDANNPVTQAIGIVGLMPLAKRMKLSYQALRKFEKTRCPGERVIELARATDWRLTPHAIRSDLYPHPDDGLPEKLRVIDQAKGIRFRVPAQNRKGERRAIERRTLDRRNRDRRSDHV